MIVDHRKLPPALPKSVVGLVQAEIEQALGAVATVNDKFIVNPSAWCSVGQGRARRAVMNSAGFISKTFQRDLEQSGWQCEYKRRDQKIDAFKAVTEEYESVTISEAGVRGLLELFFDGAASLNDIVFGPHLEGSSRLPAIVRSLYGMYVDRRIHTAPAGNSDVASFFTRLGNAERTVRFGLEFETGNIASAFRSLMKLNILYELNEIDVGIFVTTDRESATSIWPSSNRNGSFEELENRRYQRNVLFPIWEVLFKPDAYDRSAQYLAADGSLYEPQETSETFAVDGQNLRVFLSDSGARVYQDPTDAS